MRPGLLAVAVLASIAGARVPAAFDLHGATRAGNRAEPYAVVWLDAPQGITQAPVSKVVLDQRNLDFFPRILAVRVGTVVEFPNNDRVFHNVFSFHDGKRFDLGLYPVGTMKRVTFDHPGLSRIFCNIHPNMAAHVMSLDTPYFTVSDADGRFAMAAVPPGTYTYHAWRPGRADLTGSVVVGPGASSLEIRWR
ncbi:MAG: carboxypeptidase regulatory-like domain-containing protein [Acidobacteriota bacterium]